MSYQNYRQIKAIEQKNKKRLLEVNPRLDEKSGIYFLTREDEQGFRYAYIGQAVHILTRLAQHLVGYQHIDLSLKKHGLYSENNPYGWKVNFRHYTTNLLDEVEQLWIKQYATYGYQLRNKTSGSQGEGKSQIADYRPQKGYRDGLKQGRINLARELSSIAEKHLKIEIRDDKKNNKISQKQFEKFKELLSEELNRSGEQK
ncbi:GIY-YIG nuclease family protein [Faecalicatena acetigenes]|uniref:GIY-YIG nuclease family protein n=1 Tax=Faecalicatena acetigenes TaxID=2981790 RepID=A0ABT2TCS3_9FIRM|nr:GIY-YIG nuclease family protein [Faecalicatena acetigenes]MCU6748080.1 GIY-YIG nuclease family protein [Faecalicatena acetigenes]SCI24491.1 Uncharacterised protein [uncultured Clostridium sp.]